MAANSEPSTGLLAVGDQCSAQYCNLVDFLPFKCQHCEHKFCGDHYLPDSHKCDKYDEHKHNRVAPSCPLCNTPITIPVGQDPNIPMERHITNDCSVMTGKAKESSQPHCANPRCKKLLFAPIPCDKCNQQFCPQHRFPSDHACKTATTQTPTHAPSKPTTNTTSNINNKAQNLATEASARSNAAMAAIKRSMTSKTSTVRSKPSTSSNPQPPQSIQKSSSSTSSSSKTNLNPLSKTDRSPSLSSAHPPPAPAPTTKRTSSADANDVTDQPKLTKSGFTFYAPPSLFTSV